MSRARKAADRIQEEVSLAGVLVEYGYNVYEDGDHEQQFSCDLHGDGSDSKPSARLYPDSNQFFCFACGRSRDSIALVQEKEGIGFWEAVKKLETRWGLAPLPWEKGDDAPSPEKAVLQELEKALRPVQTPEQALKRLERFLQGMTTDRALTPPRIAGFWEAHDRVVAYLREGVAPEKAVDMSQRILDAAKTALRGNACIS